MAGTVVTLNDLEGHSPVSGLFKCNLSNFCAAFYTISTLTVCSHGSSAMAELLVSYVSTVLGRKAAWTLTAATFHDKSI